MLISIKENTCFGSPQSMDLEWFPVNVSCSPHTYQRTDCWPWPSPRHQANRCCWESYKQTNNKKSDKHSNSITKSPLFGRNRLFRRNRLTGSGNSHFWKLRRGKSSAKVNWSVQTELLPNPPWLYIFIEVQLIRNGLELWSLKGAPAVHFNLPLLSYYLYTTFKSGLPLHVSLFLWNRGGLMNADTASCRPVNSCHLFPKLPNRRPWPIHQTSPIPK